MPKIGIFDQRRTLAVYDIGEIKPLVAKACQANFATIKRGDYRKAPLIALASGNLVGLTKKLRVLNDLGYKCINCEVSAQKAAERRLAKGEYSRSLRAGGATVNLRFFDQVGNRESEITLDHVVPACIGGANEAGNLVPLCSRCNSRKGNRTTHYSVPKYRHRDILELLLKEYPQYKESILQEYSQNLKQALAMVPALSETQAQLYAQTLCKQANLLDLRGLGAKKMPGALVAEFDDPWLKTLALRTQTVLENVAEFRE